MLVKLNSSTKGDNSFGFMYVLSMQALRLIFSMPPKFRTFTNHHTDLKVWWLVKISLHV